MSAVFTPGPWTYLLGRHGSTFEIEKGDCLIGSLSWNGPCPDRKTSEANAQLIVTAPDLYSALEGLVEATRLIGSPVVNDAITVAKAALIKARQVSA
jgi:hypothetical protein